MASERDEARQNISDETDADFSGPIGVAERLRHLTENNRHKRQMASGERGIFGVLVGGKDQAPTTIAFVAMLLGMAIGAWCLYQGTLNAGDHDFWAKQSERAFLLATSALSFVFGRSSN